MIDGKESEALYLDGKSGVKSSNNAGACVNQPFDVEKKDIERDGGGLIAFTSSSSKSSLVT